MSPVERVPYPISQLKLGSLQMTQKVARAPLTYPPHKGSLEVKLTSEVTDRINMQLDTCKIAPKDSTLG